MCRQYLYLALGMFISTILLCSTGCSKEETASFTDGDRDDVDGDAELDLDFPWADGDDPPDIDGDEGEVEAAADGDPFESEYQRTVEPYQTILDDPYEQEIFTRTRFTPGACSNEVRSVVPIEEGGSISVALTANGICRLFSDDGSGSSSGRVEMDVFYDGGDAGSEFVDGVLVNGILIVAGLHDIHFTRNSGFSWDVRHVHGERTVRTMVEAGTGGTGSVYIGTDTGVLFFNPDSGFGSTLLYQDRQVNALTAAGGKLYVGTESGLLLNFNNADMIWTVADGLPSNDVRALANLADDSVLIATGSGMAILQEGVISPLPEYLLPLPYTSVDGILVSGEAPKEHWYLAGENGLQLHDGERWRVFSGRRFLPDDRVRDVFRDLSGLWIATRDGLSRLHSETMTLEIKSEEFVERIEQRHLRDGFVAELALLQPGDLANPETLPSDNDALATAIYGAAECLRFTMQGRAEAKEHARAAFKALMKMEAASGIEGYPAQTLIDAEQHPGAPGEVADGWHLSEDGKWWWKDAPEINDLAAHIFAYALYADACAHVEVDLPDIVAIVRRIADHLLDHDYCFVGPDSLPAAGGCWNFESLQDDPSNAGLRALELLATFALAYDLTEDDRYREAIKFLARDQHYAFMLAGQKDADWARYSNHGLDLVAFMMYYVLAPRVEESWFLEQLDMSFHSSWKYERIEEAPLFNLIYASAFGGDFDKSLSLRQLRRFPLDTIAWSMDVSERRDLRPYAPAEFISEQTDWYIGRDGHCLPVDERPMIFAGDNPFAGLSDDGGMYEGGGAGWLLAYWLGIYHGLIEATEELPIDGDANVK